MARPRVLVLGGVDPCGGAGITADARVLELHRCHPLAVATCLTVQNRFGFTAVQPVPPTLLEAMLRAAMDDGALHSVKLGMFADVATLACAAATLAKLRIPVVIDPVLSASAGGYAAADRLVLGYREALSMLRPIMTPNLGELHRLAPEGQAAELLALGCAAVVVKGGHGEGVDVVDLVHTREGVVAVRHARADCGRVHGTGCAFAAALAGRLADGQDVAAAVAMATRWVGDCLRAMGESQAAAARPFLPRALA